MKNTPCIFSLYISEKEMGQGLHRIECKAYGWLIATLLVSRTTVLLPSKIFKLLKCTEFLWILFWCFFVCLFVFDGGIFFGNGVFFLIRGCKMELWIWERTKSLEEGLMWAEDRCGTKQRCSKNPTLLLRSKTSLQNITSLSVTGNFNTISKQGAGLPSPAGILPDDSRPGRSTWSLGAEWSRGRIRRRGERVRQQQVSTGHQPPSFPTHMQARVWKENQF